ncbi:hypothetical protein FIBSPDRAFT_122729 [Athelia psychrophila]|uniref:F-box domain-containing protein n=1 Tax=Athelia psychrophila TaxID=1759441 RepID=A0A166CLU7_9AGAM|nr:hypothetical protein FIBSPDRAFT_122729 [Fibularhizoctonia sp. CBS 109695]
MNPSTSLPEMPTSIYFCPAAQCLSVQLVKIIFLFATSPTEQACDQVNDELPNFAAFATSQGVAQALSHVSPSWRSLAITYPDLWTSFRISPTPNSIRYFEQVISPRVGPHLLQGQIYVHDTPPIASIQAIGELLRPHMLSVIQVVAPSSQRLKPLLSAMQLSRLQGLRTLSIENRDENGKFHVNLPNSFSSLRSLLIHNADGLAICLMLNLTSLVLSGRKKRIPLCDLMAALSNAQNLKRLSLIDTPVQFGPNKIIDVQPIELPHLDHVSILGFRSRGEPTRRYLGKLFDSFVVPNTCIGSLSVDVGWEAAEVYSVLRLPVAETKIWCLRSLRLAFRDEMLPSHDHVADLFKTTPPINQASLHITTYGYTICTTLGARQDVPVRYDIRVPGLKTLELFFDTSQFKRFVATAGAKRNGGLKRFQCDTETFMLLESKGDWEFPLPKKTDACQGHVHITLENRPHDVPWLCLRQWPV